MVCPTCFCTNVKDVTDLTGDHAERWMEWASCFEFDFTFVHEGSVRQSGPSRYRHWLTHKLGTWHDQFGSPAVWVADGVSHGVPPESTSPRR